MADTIITPPAFEPVEIEELKGQLNIDHEDDDPLLARKIVAARQLMERLTGRTLPATTFELVLDEFPASRIELPRYPLRSVVRIHYFARDTGAETLLAPAAYTVDIVSEPGTILAAVGGWPPTAPDTAAVRIHYVAGYAPEDMPEPLREAVLMLAAHWYENREATVIGESAQALPFAVDQIIREYRTWRFG